MPDELPLRNFEIEGFRAIRRLHIPELRRVNLFVGKNNAGKTSLLEAIHLFLRRNTRTIPLVVYEVVRDHTDYRAVTVVQSRHEPEPADLQFAVDSVESLFHGSFDGESFEPIRLAQRGDVPESLTIRLPWSSGSFSPAEGGKDSGRPVLIDPAASLLDLESETGTTAVPLEWILRRIPIGRPELRSPALMIGATGLSPLRTRQMWDRVALAGDESLVEEAVRIMVPDLERILLVGEAGHRSVLLKLHGVWRPVPMQGMGDGVNRVFGIAVALTLARGGGLLLDEVENGIHYSVQEEIWSAIFSLAARFDVQVFATSHSWDSVLGFQYAAGASVEDGMLYRLERQPGGEIDPVAFSEVEVAIAARHAVEIR